jgi:hypothetical protein
VTQNAPIREKLLLVDDDLRLSEMLREHNGGRAAQLANLRSGLRSGYSASYSVRDCLRRAGGTGNFYYSNLHTMFLDRNCSCFLNAAMISPSALSLGCRGSRNRKNSTDIA